jgi:glutathione S-transferase
VAGGPSVRLYRAEWSTNCERVGLALAYKGVEAESVLIEYSNRRPVEVISGQGLVPVIDDGGTVVNDSVAIIEYLERRTPEPPLYPADPALHAEVDLFIDWFERVYKAAPNAIEDELEAAAPDEGLVAELSAEMRPRLDLFERLLEGRDFLFGEFGAADCVAYPFLKYAAARGPADDDLFHVILDEHQPLGDDHPNLSAWIERVSERPRAY